MNINWKVRIKNKLFWVAIIPAVFMLIQQVLSLFGISFDTTILVEALIDIVGTVFTILAILGIVIDPTTKGASDSEQALTYDEPKA